VQNSVDRSLAECVEAEVGVALSMTEKIDRWSKSEEETAWTQISY